MNRYTEHVREWIDGLHWAWAILFFWGVGILRTSIVFGLGRLAATGGNQLNRIRSLLKTPIYLKAQSFVNRWGVLAVPACFFTVGFQTAVIITTGFTRMPLKRWILAMLLGTFCWGIIYGTVGMAVIWAWIERPWIATPVILVLALIAFIFHRVSSPKRPHSAARK